MLQALEREVLTVSGNVKKPFKDKGVLQPFVSFSAHHTDLMFSVNASELMVFIP